MTTRSIPVEFFANVSPTVVDAGGTGLSVIGLLLTNDTRVPVDTVASFASKALVEAHFGSGSPEAAFAEKYFEGYDGSPIKPARLLISQFTAGSVRAYLEGGVLASTLATLTALGSGTITLSVNGVPITSGAISLGSATSYSDVAARVQAALAYSDAQFTGAISGNTLTVSAVAGGTLKPGQAVVGAGVDPTAQIISQLSGAAGSTGTYQITWTAPADVASEAMTAGPLVVSYDSQADAFVLTLGTPGEGDSITVADDGKIATGLKLTAATGAVVSPGDLADVPGAFMDALKGQNSNWVLFTTLFEPSHDQKVAFGTWANAQNNRYGYVCWSSVPADAVPNDTTGAFYAIGQANLSAVHKQFAPVNKALAAAFVMGAGASIDFAAPNGRRNFAFLQQSGLLPDVSDQGVAAALKDKRVSFYGVFGSASETFERYYGGYMSGPFLWLDSWVDQVWLNDNLKVSLATLLADAPNIPYNSAGYTLIAQHLSDQIDAAVRFGAIRDGVALTNAQAARVNGIAGQKIDSTITTRGWALVILPAAGATRQARGTPPIYFFYTDGQSVQELALTSAEIA